MSRDYRLYLDDMRMAAEKVLRYTQGADLAHFVDDEKTFDAVVRNLEIIGEAAKHVSAEVQERYPESNGGVSPDCVTLWLMSTSGLMKTFCGTSW